MVPQDPEDDDMWDIENENEADQTIDSKKVILNLLPFTLKMQYFQQSTAWSRQKLSH
jgi:hypothetical protein